MGKNSHEFLLSTTSCNVFSKNTRVSIVKLGQTFKHLDSFRARCQTPTWPPSLPHWRSWVCFPCVLAISNRLESCSAEQLHVLHLTGIQKVQQTQVGAVMANPVGGVGWMQSTVWKWSPAGRAHPTGCIPCLSPAAPSAVQGRALVWQEMCSGPLVMAQDLLSVTLSIAGLGTCFSKWPFT